MAPEQHALDRRQMLVAAVLHQRLGGRQRHHRANRLARALHRAHLEPLRHREEPHDGGRFGPLAERQRAGHRDAPSARGCRACGAAAIERLAQPAAPPASSNRRGRTRATPSAGSAASGLYASPAPTASAGERQRPDAVAPTRASDAALVLEPRAHAGLGHRVDDARCVSDGGVVGHVQLLPEHVDRQALHAGQRRQTALEDAALPRRSPCRRRETPTRRAPRTSCTWPPAAGGGHASRLPRLGRATSSTCRSPCRKSVTMWRSSSE